MVNALVKYYADGNKARFANMLGVSAQTISAWIARKTFDAELIYAKCSDIAANWLLTGQGNMLQDTPDTSSHNQAIQESNELLQRHEELNSEYIALSRELRESNKEIRELRRQLDEARAAKEAAEARITQLELRLAVQKKATERPSAQYGDTPAVSPSNNL